MKVDCIVIEGVHLRRGSIAALCSRQAVPEIKTIGLSWNQTFLPDCTDETIACNTLKSYYHSLRRLLAGLGNALFIPCTQTGISICNSLAGKNTVLAEPALSDNAKFDKLSLKAGQPRLMRFFPPYSPVDKGALLSFPLLAKLRTGHSSSHQHIIRSEAELRKMVNPEEYFVEKLITDPFEEYSLTLIRSAASTSWMCIKRIAQHGGRTTIAGLEIDDHTKSAAAMIASNLNFSKIYNVQFAMVGRNPIIYDLNPRFGHSELYRTCFGFNFIGKFLGENSRRICLMPEIGEMEAFNLLQEWRKKIQD